MAEITNFIQTECANQFQLVGHNLVPAKFIIPSTMQTQEETASENVEEYTIDVGGLNITDISDESMVICQVVYPEDLNLKPILSNKRGRPKRKKTETVLDLDPPTVNVKKVSCVPPKSARTRSGRLVKLPKHIKQDFKKIDITQESEIKVTEFVRFEEDKSKTTELLPIIESHQRKRTIASQFRCPKCQKAYLGKTRMIEHLKKYPDHGPLPEGYNNLNFDVWNYLVDITQKCAPGQRGAKFCEELTNLLHNVQLLTSALFKTANNQKSSVEIDKVLGNAIGLAPGKYNFYENELYKDVTVLKLITNTDFFVPSKQPTVPVSEPKKPLDDKFAAKCDDYFVQQNQAALHLESAQKSVEQNLDNILTANSLLSSLPNLRTVDELLDSVDTSANILDNSTSSDEVMNVDQFVNERFKKITEPDIETLNLELPPLDLFNFHGT